MRGASGTQSVGGKRDPKCGGQAGPKVWGGKWDPKCGGQVGPMTASISCHKQLVLASSHKQLVLASSLHGGCFYSVH